MNRDKLLTKVPTGIKGLDELTYGGLPEFRSTLLCGQAGCGKTLLGLEFLLRGATEFNEPGVFISFEEKEEEIIKNVASLGFDLQKLIDEKKIYLEYIKIDPNEFDEAGDYNLEALFIRLNHAIDSIGAKRVILDTIEVIFNRFKKDTILRAEIRRLFGWLSEKQVTSIVTGEKGNNSLTRHGLEEYVSDCVIVLNNSGKHLVFTRKIRIVKYRGSKHEPNEFPFIIDSSGINILPITSINLDYNVSNEKMSTGIKELNSMLGGNGFYRGSSVLISGTSGTGKTSLGTQIVHETCKKGEKVLFLSYEEPSSQIIRNMSSININLNQWVKKGLLTFYNERSSRYGLETHLTKIHRLIETHKPSLVFVDPINSFLNEENEFETKTMLVKLFDYIKSNQITGIFTNLSHASIDDENTDLGISSMIDCWIILKDIEIGGERNRGIFVLKSRGLANSNQIRELLITSQGLKIKDVYVGPFGVLTGSSRIIQESVDLDELESLEQKMTALNKQLKRKSKEIGIQQQLLENKLKEEETDIINQINQLNLLKKQKELTIEKLKISRKV